MDLKGICLRATDYKEKDKLLTIATLEKGIITVKAAGARSPKAKLKSGCMPLVWGEFSVAKTKSGFILKGISVQENFYNCWKDTHKNLSAMLILEILENFAVKGQSLAHEILLCLKALKIINYDGVYPYAAALWFFLKMLVYAGADYSEEDIPRSIMEILHAVNALEADDIETADLLTENIDRALYYLGLIANSRLSVKLKLINQISDMFLRKRD